MLKNTHYNFYDQTNDIILRKDDCVRPIANHMHKFIEIVYITKGTGTHYINDVPYPVQRGDLLFINFKQTHAFNFIDGMELINIDIKPRFIDAELMNSENAFEMLALSSFDSFKDIKPVSPYVNFSGKELIEVENIISQMMEEYEQKRTNYFTVVKGLTMVLLTKIFRQMQDSQLTPIVQHMNRLTPEILKYIEENFFEKITLQDLAHRCFYNSSYFSKIFKESFGKNLTDFIQEKRVEQAIEYLKKKEYSIEEIMSRVGFSDKKQFYKVFKKYTNLTPGEFRDQVK